MQMNGKPGSQPGDNGDDGWEDAAGASFEGVPEGSETASGQQDYPEQGPDPEDDSGEGEFREAEEASALQPILQAEGSSPHSGKPIDQSGQQSQETHSRKRKLKKHPMHYHKSEFHRHRQEEHAHSHSLHETADADAGKSEEAAGAKKKMFGLFSRPKHAWQHQQDGKLAQHEAAEKYEDRKPFAPKGALGIFDRAYHSHYRALLWVTWSILILSFIVLGVSYFTTGEFVQKGVSIKGGVSITIDLDSGSQIDIAWLESILEGKYPASDISVRALTSGGIQQGVTVEATDISVEELKGYLQSAFPGIPEDRFFGGSTGSSLGSSFFRQTITIVLVALVCMAIVIFIYFRMPIPSLAIMLAVVCTSITTLAVFNLVGMRLSTEGVAAFLMLLGYSIDTDVVLSVRVLKKKEGTVYERVLDAMKTGMAMTTTALAAVIVAYFLTNSEVIKQIMFILMVGLVCDMLYTWIQNAGILRWYLERQARQ